MGLENQTPGAPYTPRIAIEYQVMFFDTDCAGVVHNLAYLRIIETARTLLAEEMGWKLTTMGSTGIYPVLVRTEIDYKRPAVLGDQLVVRGALTRLERVRFHCGFEIARKESPEVLVACEQVLALVQMPDGRPLRLPGDFAVRFAHLRA